MTRLFQLAENCNSGTDKEENIRDQLIDKCRSHVFREKLLAVSGKLTLQKARDVARSMEAAERQARSIEGDSKGENVNTLEGARGKGKKEGRFPRDPECTARLATCGKCKKVGHFVKVCRTKSDDKTTKGDIRQVSEDDGFAFTIQTRGKEIPTVDIELGGVQLKGVLVDSGSTSNVTDRGTWEMLKRNNIKCD